MSRSPGSADSGRVQHVKRRRALEQVPVAEAVADPESGRGYETSRRCTRQRRVKAPERLLVVGDVNAFSRSMREDVRQQSYLTLGPLPDSIYLLRSAMLLRIPSAYCPASRPPAKRSRPPS